MVGALLDSDGKHRIFERNRLYSDESSFTERKNKSGQQSVENKHFVGYLSTFVHFCWQFLGSVP